MRVSLLYILFTVFSFSICAQKITNIDFMVVSNELKISYDIEYGLKNRSYDLKVVVELIKKGSNQVIKTISPTSITGDISKVKPGKGKVIIWDVLNDINKLEGEINVEVIVSNSYTLNPNNKWGPEAALTSLLFPGLGNYLVNKTEKSAQIGGYTFLGYAGSLYFAYESNKSSKENYAAYQNSVLQSQMDDYYEKANSDNKLAYSMLGVAGAILASEFTYVLIKGTSNKFKKEYALGRLPKINLVYLGNGFGFGLSKSF